MKSNFRTLIATTLLSLTIITGLNLSVAQAATESIAIIRPDCENKSIPTANCYTSLYLWEAGEQRDLTATDEIAIAQIEGSWTSADTTAVNINGWTTSATNYIKIYTTAEARHDGKWNEGKYRLETTGAVDSLTIVANYSQIEGVQIKNIKTGHYQDVIEISYATNVSLDKLIIYSTGGNYIGGGIKTRTNDNLYISNCLVKSTSAYSHSENTGIGYNSNITLTPTFYIYNTTVIGFAYGYYLSASTPTLTCKNCISQNASTAGYSIPTSTGSEYNISDDATALGTNSKNSTTVTFIDSANEDYHISSSDISALDAGTDLSADANLAFATDIDGDTRSTWDIGADEYVASVSSAAGSFSAYKQSIPPPVISNVTVDVEGDKAIVKWKTDKPAISEVYWSDKFYWLNRVEIERSFKTNHSVVLKVNIEKDTKYYFKVRSTDNYNTGFDYKLYSFVIPEKIESEDLSELDLETLPEQKEIDNSEARVSSIDDLKVSHSLDSNLALDLKWSDSNEVSLVESYSIFKNGSFLLKTNSPSFTDSNILPSSYYSYYVVVNGNNNTKSNSSNVVGIMSTDKITGNGIVGVRETEISGIESIKTLLQKQIDSLFFLIERLKILLEG